MVEKDWPLLITLMEEKRIFQNVKEIRDTGEPSNKVKITHDLTKK